MWRAAEPLGAANAPDTTQHTDEQPSWKERCISKRCRSKDLSSTGLQEDLHLYLGKIASYAIKMSLPSV